MLGWGGPAGLSPRCLLFLQPLRVCVIRTLWGLSSLCCPYLFGGLHISQIIPISFLLISLDHWHSFFSLLKILSEFLAATFSAHQKLKDCYVCLTVCAFCFCFDITLFALPRRECTDLHILGKCSTSDSHSHTGGV